jgi:putative glutamine amidotransferase
MGIDHPLRIGLSTRISKAEGYDELRDSLAQDWILFMRENLPGIEWQMLPNEGASIVERIRTWGINGLMLTGGNNIGEYPQKDETDNALFSFALNHDLPVLGICRGLQVMANFFGVPLDKCTDGSHRAQRHPVQVLKSPGETIERFEVNSYHTFVIRGEMMKDPLETWALGDDGTVEALAVKGKPAFALMWHPERERTIDAFTEGILGKLFKGDSTWYNKG